MKSIEETTLEVLKKFLYQKRTLECVLFIPSDGFVSRSAPFDFDAKRFAAGDKIPVVVNDKRVSVGSIMFDMDNTTRVFIFEDNDSSRYLHVYSKFYSINNGVKFLVNIPFLDFAIQRYESL